MAVQTAQRNGKPHRTKSYSSSLLRDLGRDRYLYALLVPGILFFIVFCYIPMYGVVIAFKEYNIYKGIFGSPWVGLLQFERLFRTPTFPQVIGNTVLISLYKLIFGFPAPILLALLLNEMRSMAYKRITQTALYLPYFVSWVIMAGLIQAFLSPTTGMVNDVVKFFGGKPISFLLEKSMFRSILVITDIYKGVGWGTIIYLAALSGVPVDLYEAAMLDGASKLRQAWHITLPSIRNVVIIMLILSLGSILNAGFDQVFLLYNPTVYETGDIIDTYVYRKGIVESSYSLVTAAGLFKSVISMILIFGANKVAHLFGDDGIW